MVLNGWIFNIIYHYQTKVHHEVINISAWRHLSRHLESGDLVRGGGQEAGGWLPILCLPDLGEGEAEEVLGLLGEHRDHLSGPDCAVACPIGLVLITLGWKK